jgi:hypothetical protein
MEANGNCRTHTGRNRRWAAPRKTIDQCSAIIGAQTGVPEQGRNGMSINTAKCRATCSFGAELIVREREFIDA